MNQNQLSPKISNAFFTTFWDYWKLPIVQDLKMSERIKYCLFLFSGVVLIIFSVDFISGIPMKSTGMILGLLIKGFAYTLGIFMAEIAITYFSKKKNPYSGLSVGKAWLISLVGYIIGFLMLAPYRAYLGHLDHHGAESTFGFFIQISPIWAAMTFFFIQLHLKRSLSRELDALRLINADIKKPPSGHTSNAISETKPQTTNSITLPNKHSEKELEIKTENITHVNVIEHYSYLYFFQEDEINQYELKMPLKEIQSMLPETSFVQIHRSYLVNVQHINRVKKIPRSYEVFLNGLDEPITISRYRLSEILPILDDFLKESNNWKYNHLKLLNQI